jgi:protein-L-isoaspartate(D-aspartate) O-methyltransferase
MNFSAAKLNMIQHQFKPWEVFNPVVLGLFEKIDRRNFVPPRYQHLAFADMTIPLGHGQTMLAPREEARILEALDIQENERVLEVGTGSGFFTALLSQQAKHVDSVEIFEDLIKEAFQRLQRYAIHNTVLHLGDAAAGFKKNNHYDVIVITGSLPVLPKSFFSQLNMNGRLFAILGKPPIMRATLITKISEVYDNMETTPLFDTYVSPLLNAHVPSEFVL